MGIQDRIGNYTRLQKVYRNPNTCEGVPDFSTSPISFGVSRKPQDFSLPDHKSRIISKSRTGRIGVKQCLVRHWSISCRDQWSGISDVVPEDGHVQNRCDLGQWTPIMAGLRLSTAPEQESPSDSILSIL